MAPRKAADKAEAPKKIEPTAPAEIPPDVMFRGKASRPTFRRGGLVFGDRDWTPIDPEAEGVDFAAILAEPVLTLQVNAPKLGWVATTVAQRSELLAAAAKDTGQQ